MHAEVFYSVFLNNAILTFDKPWKGDGISFGQIGDGNIFRCTRNYQRKIKIILVTWQKIEEAMINSLMSVGGRREGAQSGHVSTALTFKTKAQYP